MIQLINRCDLINLITQAEAEAEQVPGVLPYDGHVHDALRVAARPALPVDARLHELRALDQAHGASIYPSTCPSICLSIFLQGVNLHAEDVLKEPNHLQEATKR